MGKFMFWFLSLKRYNNFVNSVIASAREGTSVSQLFYQNDIESKHFVEKLAQCFKKETVLVVIRATKSRQYMVVEIMFCRIIIQSSKLTVLDGVNGQKKDGEVMWKRFESTSLTRAIPFECPKTLGGNQAFKPTEKWRSLICYLTDLQMLPCSNEYG